MQLDYECWFILNFNIFERSLFQQLDQNMYIELWTQALEKIGFDIIMEQTKIKLANCVVYCSEYLQFKQNIV